MKPFNWNVRARVIITVTKEVVLRIPVKKKRREEIGRGF